MHRISNKLSPWVRASLALVCALYFIAEPARAERFQVGAGREYDRPSAVAVLARDGDVVEIDAGDRVADNAPSAFAVNNLFVGPGQVVSGKVEQRNNLSLSEADLVNRAQYDYHLTAGSRAIGAGTNPGQGDGVALAPTAQYEHPRRAAPRRATGPFDVGAYEYRGGGRP
jgi:hypothetical protein